MSNLPSPSFLELHLEMTLSSKFMAFPTKYINMYIYTYPFHTYSTIFMRHPL